MTLTIEITDMQLDQLKEALKVREADYDLAVGYIGLIKNNPNALYAHRILVARRALGLVNSHSDAVVIDDKLCCYT